MRKNQTPPLAQPPPTLGAPAPAHGRPRAVLVLISEPPRVVAADLVELRRGGCTARCDGTVCTETDGVLSICLDGEYISRPVRVGGVAPDNTASLVFCPIPNLDPRWADLVLNGG